MVNFDTLNHEDDQYQNSLYVGHKMTNETDDDFEEIYFDEYDYRSKLEAIVEFADQSSWFDGSMYEDMLYKLDETNFLTDKQKEVIDNIYDQFC